MWKGLNIYKCFEWKTNTWTCELLQLRLNVQDYDWTFHPDSLFLSIYCENETHLYFCERRVFLTYKWLPLGHTQGYDWTFHPGSLFLSLMFEIVEVWIIRFELAYEKSLMLGQTFDLSLQIKLIKWFELYQVLKLFEVDSENGMIWENCSMLDRALFLFFLKDSWF